MSAGVALCRVHAKEKKRGKRAQVTLWSIRMLHVCSCGELSLFQDVSTCESAG